MSNETRKTSLNYNIKLLEKLSAIGKSERRTLTAMIHIAIEKFIKNYK